MSSFKSYWSSLKYHAVTRPSIDVARHAIKKTGGALINRFKQYRYSKGHGRKPGLRAAIMQKTRGSASTSKTLFSKGTVAGQKRRALAAARIKTIRSGTRRPSGAPTNVPTPQTTKPARASTVKAPLTKVTPKTRTANRTVSGAIATSKTHGQLRRKLTGLATRSVTLGMGLGQTRTMTAHQIKALRKKMPGMTRGLVKNAKGDYMRRAAEQLAKNK